MQEIKKTIEHNKMLVSNLVIDTIKKDIKNMHLGVYPPSGRIRVAVPLKMTDEAVRLFIISKMSWIKKQQLKFSKQERQTQREYVGGESHYFFGRRYLLEIIYTNNHPKIEIRKKTHINLHIKPGTTMRQREKIFEQFYRSNMKDIIPILLEAWQERMGVQVKEVKIKKMKTKWGTCNRKDRRIWLNLELAKKPLHCIDYVFVHELAHLIEKNHSQKFIQILESVLPNWQSEKEELNRTVLGYSSWGCRTN